MDLGTVQSRLVEEQYTVAEEFATDVRLVFQNCRTYNTDPALWVRECGDALSALFEDQWSLFIERRALEAEALAERAAARARGEEVPPEADEPMFLVKWSGCSLQDSTWECESDVSDELKISQFYRTNQVAAQVILP